MKSEPLLRTRVEPPSSLLHGQLCINGVVKVKGQFEIVTATVT